MKIGPLLKRLADSRSLDAVTVAGRLGVSRQAVSGTYQTHTNPRMDTVTNYLRVFGVGQVELAVMEEAERDTLFFDPKTKTTLHTTMEVNDEGMVQVRFADGTVLLEADSVHELLVKAHNSEAELWIKIR